MMHADPPAPGRPKSLTASAPAIVTMVIGVVLLVLAIWNSGHQGWGAQVWLASFCAMFLIRTPYARSVRSNAITLSRNDPGETALLIGMFGTQMVLPLLHLATGIFEFANYALPAGLTLIGAFAQLPFLWLFWRSHADLGKNWSPGLEVRDGHGLVTQGVYSRIRHPMYAAIWIGALTQPLLLHNWIAGVLVIPAFAAMWIVRTPKEEAMMRETFGPAYDAYCKRAGRLWPKQG